MEIGCTNNSSMFSELQLKKKEKSFPDSISTGPFTVEVPRVYSSINAYSQVIGHDSKRGRS